MGRLSWALGIFILVSLTCAADAAVVTLIPTLGGATSQAFAINASGTVVGTAHNSSGFRQAFSYSDGSMVNLGTLGGSTLFPVFAYSINSAGVIVGRADVPLTGPRAFRYTGSGLAENLGILRASGNLSEAIAINAAGVIVGFSDSNSTYAHGFRYTDSGGMVDLGTLGTYSNAADVNDLDVIVGSSRLIGVNTVAVLCRWVGAGPIENLGMPPGSSSADGMAINNSGVILVSAIHSGSARPWRYTDLDGWEALQMPSGFTEAIPTDINETGFAVGATGFGVSSGRALLWRPDGSVVNLDAWLDATYPSIGAGITLNEAEGINNLGQIVGTANRGVLGGTRAFILDASALLPEPTASAALLIFAAASIARRRR